MKLIEEELLKAEQNLLPAIKNILNESNIEKRRIGIKDLIPDLILLEKKYLIMEKLGYIFVNP